MLVLVLSTGLPAALLSLLFATLMWLRIDTVWSEEHPLHWLSLAATSIVAGALATVLHWTMPGVAALQPALLVAVAFALTWWGLRLRWNARREQQRG